MASLLLRHIRPVRIAQELTRSTPSHGDKPVTVSQSQLADHIEVAAPTVSNWEIGNTAIAPRHRDRLAVSLRIPRGLEPCGAPPPRSADPGTTTERRSHTLCNMACPGRTTKAEPKDVTVNIVYELGACTRRGFAPGSYRREVCGGISYSILDAAEKLVSANGGSAQAATESVKG